LQPSHKPFIFKMRFAVKVIEMKLLLDIKDEKADFIMELLKSFPYVKTKEISPAKARAIAGLKEAIDQVNLAKEGKIKLKSARQLVDEL